MKIKILTTSASPAGVLVPGQIVSLPDDEAEAMVRAGAAVILKKVERTSLEPVERTVIPGGKARKGRG